MPGGNPDAWPHVKPIFQAIAAKVADGTPCCDWVGPEGAGHFVKMVHNGIEYGDMQLICEAYHVMRSMLGMEPAAMHDVFARWNNGPLDSYLIEITRDILGFNDPETGKPMVDLILDTAGQKGTGKWTVISACDLGVPLTLISEAVFARSLSAQKDERVTASACSRAIPHHLQVTTSRWWTPSSRLSTPQDHLLRPGLQPDEGHGGGVEVGDQQRSRGPHVAGRLHHPQCLSWHASRRLSTAIPSWQTSCSIRTSPAKSRVPRKAGGASALRRSPTAFHCPAMTSGLSYFDGYRSANLPANLLQAQRDYFGAHTYERVDRPRGQFFHTNWTGRGGTTASTSYNV